MFHKNKTQETTEKDRLMAVPSPAASFGGLEDRARESTQFWALSVDMRFKSHVVIASLLAVVYSSSVYHKFFIEDVRNCPSQMGLVDVSSMRVHRVDRTKVTLRGDIIIKADLPNDTMATLTVHELKNRRWVPTALSIHDVNICEFTKTDRFFFPPLQRMSGLPKGCPFLKVSNTTTSQLLLATVRDTPHRF
ncbi:hypothetical protein AAG570_012377 [Ranatra chinensis]|uniref:Uncharacterized protein n=1 Tax=Ranatra chinensis TaxID=642074 RepID=A0ABD0YIW3_9HEMI